MACNVQVLQVIDNPVLWIDLSYRERETARRWLTGWYARREIDQGGVVPLASAQSCRPYTVSSISSPVSGQTCFGRNGFELTSLGGIHH